MLVWALVAAMMMRKIHKSIGINTCVVIGSLKRNTFIKFGVCVCALKPHQILCYHFLISIYYTAPFHFNALNFDD